MTINKFQGKTESEAIEKAKKEMGPDVVIMSVKTVKPKGMFRAFKGIAYEVTAALEENELDKMSTQAIAEARESQAQLQAQKPESINLAADEKIQIPAVAAPAPAPAAPPERLGETAEMVLKQLQKHTAAEPQETAVQAVPSSAIEER